MKFRRTSEPGTMKSAEAILISGSWLLVCDLTMTPDGPEYLTAKDATTGKHMVIDATAVQAIRYKQT